MTCPGLARTLRQAQMLPRTCTPDTRLRGGLAAARRGSAIRPAPWGPIYALAEPPHGAATWAEWVGGLGRLGRPWGRGSLAWAHKWAAGGRPAGFNSSSTQPIANRALNWAPSVRPLAPTQPLPVPLAQRPTHNASSTVEACSSAVSRRSGCSPARCCAAAAPSPPSAAGLAAASLEAGAGRA